MSGMLPIDIHNNVVKEIADAIEQQKRDLDKLYGDKIIKLCENNPSTKVYQSINMMYNDVYGTVKLTDYSTTPVYWYDYNKGRFVSPINGYQGKIFHQIKFQINLSEYILHQESTYKTYLEMPNKISVSASNNPIIDGVQRTSANITTLHSGHPYNISGCSSTHISTHQCGPNLTLHIMIDDHLNIYLPNYNVIIVRNYDSFSFGSIDNVFNMHDIIVYNDKNGNDKQMFNNINHFNTQMITIQSKDSQDKYNNDLFDKLFNFIEYNTKIDKIKKNITYIDIIMSNNKTQLQIQDKLNSVETKLTQALKDVENKTSELTHKTNELENKTSELEKVNHMLTETKKELDKYTNIIIPDMSPEEMKCKIQNLEKTIMTLENDLSTYKGEISVYKQYYNTRQLEILQLQENNINLTEIIAKNQIDIIRYTNEIINIKMLQSTISSLHQQIKEIDAIRDSENINFNKKIIELTSIISNLELDKIDQGIKITKITELEIDIDKMKSIKIADDEKMQKLNDAILKLNIEKQSVISKCVLLNDRIIELEKQKKSIEESVDVFKCNEDDFSKKIYLLENMIEEKETEISIMKANKISSLDIVGKKGDYETILYSQIKELENENIKYKQLIVQKENDIKTEKNKHSAFENKIKSLLQ